MTRKSFAIVDGPSKFDLMVALFNRDIVQFTLEDVGKSRDIYNVEITGVRTYEEKIYPETWEIEGYCTPYKDNLRLEDVLEGKRVENLVRAKLATNRSEYIHFNGWYDGRRRSGIMTLEAKNG